MAKQSQLVSQHLENISAEALSEYQDIIRAYVRRRQGIYALYRKNKLYYVGLASNLRSRLKDHLRDRHRELWDRFSVYLTIGDSHLKELESLILRTIKPPGNNQAGKFIKSENLRGRLSRELRARQREELNWVIGRSTSPISKHRGQKVVKNNGPVLSAYINKSTKVRASYKGELIRARVRRNGLIRYRNKDYSSPSQAAKAVVRRACNGWSFWKFERAPGDWVKLKELRR